MRHTHGKGAPGTRAEAFIGRCRREAHGRGRHAGQRPGTCRGFGRGLTPTDRCAEGVDIPIPSAGLTVAEVRGGGGGLRRLDVCMYPGATIRPAGCMYVPPPTLSFWFIAVQCRARGGDPDPGLLAGFCFGVTSIPLVAQDPLYICIVFPLYLYRIPYTLAWGFLYICIAFPLYFV